MKEPIQTTTIGHIINVIYYWFTKKNIRLIHPGQVGTVLSKKECDNTSYQ